MNVVTAHPKITTFGIGLATTFAIGTAVGMLDYVQAFAFQSQTNTGNNCCA
jgi:hypothetical protein